MTIEELYKQMFAAFTRYARAEPLHRDALWDSYVASREMYLRTAQGDGYRPLKIQFHH